jgi:hypothetical protein
MSDSLREVIIHVATSAENNREWQFAIDPDKHVALAKEIEAEWLAGGTVSGNIDIDRPQVLFHFINGNLKDQDSTKRFASAFATRMVDAAMVQWHQGWDDVTAAVIKFEKKADGGLAFSVNVLRPKTPPQ